MFDLDRLLKKLQTRAAPSAPSTDRQRLPLELRRVREGVVVLRASNDTVVDSYGTVITVEGLHDWWEGYQQHRNVNLQHDLPELRGVRGRPMIGIATRVDFTPQLEVEIRVIDPTVDQLIDERKITGGSLEFIPTQEEQRRVAGQDARVYYRLSPEPEHTGLALVDIPAVPQSDILSVRSTLPNWAFAAIDPRVLAGEITDPAELEQLRWFPHHDTQSRMVDEDALERAYRSLDSFTLPAGASLSRDQVIQRAREHLDRHRHLGLGMRTSRPKEEIMNEWIRLRAQQYQQEGMSDGDALAKAKSDYQQLQPAVRARIEGRAQTQDDAGDDADEPDDPPGLWQRIFGGSNVTINMEGRQDAPVQHRSAPADDAADDDDEGDASSESESNQEPTELDRRVSQQVDARIAALMRQPENPMAAIASGLNVRTQRLEPDELLSEIMTRTVLPQLQRREITPQMRTEVDNLLRHHGISQRALSIEGNGTVIFEELARQFVVRPSPDIVFRNHIRSLPMSGTKKADFPRFSREGLAFQWNRSSAAGAGSTTDAATSTPDLDTFPVEVTELNGAVPLTDGFLLFNASGAQFTSQYLLPELRGAAQYEEDRAFFLSSGSHPDPATFEGLRNVTGATVITSSANGDAFTESMLDGMLRQMPTAFRANPERLAFYLPVARADDLLEIRSGRETALGDRILENDSNIPGPMPVARHRGVRVYSVPQLPTDEEQGDSEDAATIYLVHRDQPVIGDALTIRIEPYRRSGFQTLIQLQEFVGLGYQWPEAVVRRPGVRPYDPS